MFLIFPFLDQHFNNFYHNSETHVSFLKLNPLNSWYFVTDIKHEDIVFENATFLNSESVITLYFGASQTFPLVKLLEVSLHWSSWLALLDFSSGNTRLVKKKTFLYFTITTLLDALIFFFPANNHLMSEWWTKELDNCGYD